MDEYRHLGILRTVEHSSNTRTNDRASAGRSAFFALNSVGARSGSLHPLTSARLYKALCIPIMLYGAELWTLTKTERLFLERVHRKILRTILGLPVRCSSTVLTILLGMQDIETLTKKCMLSFIVATANLLQESLPRRVLAARANSSPSKGVVKAYEDLLAALNLPSLGQILTNPPKPAGWKSYLAKNLAISSYLNFLESCDLYPVSNCDFRLSKPSSICAISVGDVSLTRKNNYRLRLVVGCDGLNKDSSRFHNKRGDPTAATCSLCKNGIEDAEHFISSCQSLDDARQALIPAAPPPLQAYIPDPASSPRDFLDLIVGSNWIDDLDLQQFSIELLYSLKNVRNTKILNAPSGELS